MSLRRTLLDIHRHILSHLTGPLFLHRTILNIHTLTLTIVRYLLRELKDQLRDLLSILSSNLNIFWPLTHCRLRTCLPRLLHCFRNSHLAGLILANFILVILAVVYKDYSVGSLLLYLDVVWLYWLGLNLG